MIYDIKKEGCNILRKGNLTKIKDFHPKELQKLYMNMCETMAANEGIGLAAPQIGLHKQIFVACLSEYPKPVMMINPVILEKSKELFPAFEEGCLSVEGKGLSSKRAMKVTVSFQDYEGNVFKKDFQGLDAVVIQHEVDHLNGILFKDRL